VYVLSKTIPITTGSKATESMLPSTRTGPSRARLHVKVIRTKEKSEGNLIRLGDPLEVLFGRGLVNETILGERCLCIFDSTCHCVGA
jgi:hypothetical protein